MVSRGPSGNGIIRVEPATHNPASMPHRYIGIFGQISGVILVVLGLHLVTAARDLGDPLLPGLLVIVSGAVFFVIGLWIARAGPPSG
jgi:hypothetical protein